MKTNGNRTLLDRVCDALRISDDRRHNMRTVANTVGLNENEPVHVYLAAGEMVSEALSAHRQFMSTVPAQLRAATSAAAEDVEKRLQLTVGKAAESTGAQVEARVVAAVDAFARRQYRRHWPLFAVGLTTVMLICVTLGWSLADRSQLSSSAFWSKIIVHGKADDWQRIIELNPHLPSSVAQCSRTSGLAVEDAGGLACRVGIWLSPPGTAETHLFAQFLRDPVLFLGPTLYLITASFGALFTLAGITLVRWTRVRG